MKKKITTCLNFILIFLTPFFLKSQTVYPYLQSASSNSIFISWKTSSDMQSLVELGTDSASLNISVNGSTQVLTDTGFPNNYFYHTVKLSNLTANTRYYYKVTSGTFTSSVCSFKTLPLPGNAATADGHIRFLIMGDNEIKDQPRFDSLMVKAKRKCEEKYTGAIQENISGILMLGDQVNEGTLDQYENVHFGKSKYFLPYLFIQTAVGENELAGTLKLNAYNSLFYYDSLNYKGIYSETENYYAYQAGNVLIVYLSTEHVSNKQFTWLQQIISAANADASIHWIISLSHRPYQAEQFVGDISPWIRNTVVPYLTSSPKFLMHVAGHHHLYARGQLKNSPVYNVISGGTAWNQFWETSQEEDMDDVQKTIPNWAYNIVDIDVINGKADVETYSIGSAFKWKNNQLIDQFHRYKNKQAPLTPSITNAFGDSLQLPYTITGSAFNSPAGELLNSTEYQLSSTSSFTTIEKDNYRDYEDLFGYAVKADSSADVNAGVNILNLDLKEWSIPNGKHYVRLRYRDRNMEWSPWSAIDSFKVVKSVSGITTLNTDKKSYELADSVKVTYANGPGQ
ncbi:MAG TPA: metallophosphoesterase family protein, partial [Bacteroidia bacterium]|nr:metallophosphoesterase family protein [Bacteroidia bacterium]